MDVSPAAPAQMEYFIGNTMATPPLNSRQEEGEATCKSLQQAMRKCRKPMRGCLKDMWQNHAKSSNPAFRFIIFARKV